MSTVGSTMFYPTAERGMQCLGVEISEDELAAAVAEPAPANIRRLMWARPAAATVSRALSWGIKRGLDVLLALVLLLVIAPLSLLVVLIIQIESPGSPFYRARRVGRHGRPLDVLKFRKMHTETRGLPLTLAGDARLTRVGAFMARTRIDELPQLWNVLRGQMSLVGPRPEDPQFVELHADSYERILSVRPGITGWSQLAFAAESKILDQTDPVGHYVARILPAKVHLDSMYAERPRVRDDIRVLAWTVVTMLTRIEVAVHRETGRLAARAARTSSAGTRYPLRRTDAAVSSGTQDTADRRDDDARRQAVVS